MKKHLSLVLIIILIFGLCSPSYAAGLFEDLKEYGGNIFDVPAYHPRLLFTSDDIPQIIANSKNAENKEAMKAFNSALLRNTFNVLDVNSEDNSNNNILFSIQAKAFNHAVFGGNTGADAVESMIDYLKKFRYPSHDFSALQSYHQVTYTIYNASLVYDWCYDILTKEQEEYIRTKLLELADSEHAFNSLTNGLSPFGGTGTSNYIFRDFLSLGIALYDTNPEIFNFIKSQIDNVYKPIDEYFSPSHSSFYGYQYGAFALYGHSMAYRLMDAIGYKKIFTDDMFHALDYYMLSRMPDGNNLIEGDDYLRADGEFKLSMDDSALTMISAVASHYLKDNKFKSFLSDLSLTHTAFWYGTICFTPIDSLLLVESQGTVTEHQFEKSRYFGSPMGMIIATNGEGKEKATVKMKISEGYKWHHQHYDAGSFEIYYKGRLTGQSAQYSRTDIAQYSNYYVQSVASNTLLIKDPDEKFTYWNTNQIAENSGGQRIKRTFASNLGEWLSHEAYNTGKITGYYSSDSFSYLSGDITNAYSDKVSEVKRYMSFIPKDKGGMMFVIDKINASDSAFEKTFLLHTPAEPEISDNTVTVIRNTNGYGGKLTLKAIYPEVDINGVGGEGKQWYVNGTNYEPLESYAPELKNNPLAYGWGRIEVSPKKENKLDYLVNVIYIDDAESKASEEAYAIKGTGVIGGESEGEAVVIATSTERNKDTLSFALKNDGNVRIANLSEGYWNVYNGSTLTDTVYATEESGMISFASAKGEIKLEYCDNNKFSGGLGTKEIPYVIKTSQDFLDIEKENNGGVYYIQANDITLGSYAPFDFNGSYDGNGKTLTVNIASENEGTGLFASLSGNAEIKNLKVKGTVKGRAYTGGFAGKIINPVKITVHDCVNYADVTSSVKGAGGFFGEAYYGSGISSSTFVIKNLVNHGEIRAPYWAGGITGVTKIYHSQMANYGNIISPGESGGIVGLCYSTVSESLNNGYISGSPAGGIAGKTISGSVESCFNSGSIELNKFKISGGIIGAADRSSVKYSYDAGMLNNPSFQIIGKIITDKGETTVKSCYYLNPSAAKGISGSYPLTSEQLKGFSVGSAFVKSNTAYNYPQLKNNIKLTDETELTVLSVNAEHGDIYPFEGTSYVKKGTEGKFWIVPDSYYKLTSVTFNGKEIGVNSQNLAVAGKITEKSNLTVDFEPLVPTVKNIKVYDGDFNIPELYATIPGYLHIRNSNYILVCSEAEGLYTDCGFVITDNVEEEYISSFRTGGNKYSYGLFIHSENPASVYIKPYVKDRDGNYYFGKNESVSTR